MPTMNDFERRRHERRRREKLRRKRIRALLLLLLFIVLVVLICVGISRCGKSDKNTTSQNNNSISSTVAPSASSVPTAMPTSSSFSNFPAASVENDLMTIIRNSGQEKCCYITFDDGPTTQITPQILDTLRRYNVKATFFEIGQLIKANPDLTRRVYEEGHLIANHSYKHEYEQLYESTDSFMSEINDCYEQIKKATGEAEPFKLIRFPGGGFKSSYDSYSPMKQKCKDILKENGFYYCDWNALNGDAEGAKKDADELLEYMIENLDGESNVVVLMHDAANKQATADALASILEYFIDNGYTFHRLDEIEYNPKSTATASPSATPSSDDDDDDDSDLSSSSSSDSSSSSSSSSSSGSSSSGSSSSGSSRSSSGSSSSGSSSSGSSSSGSSSSGRSSSSSSSDSSDSSSSDSSSSDSQPQKTPRTSNNAGAIIIE